jgi:hypothetical protein
MSKQMPQYRQEGRRDPMTFMVDRDNGVVIRAPTFREVCEMDLSQLPTETVRALSLAFAEELRSRATLRERPIYRVQPTTVRKSGRRVHRSSAPTDSEIRDMAAARLEHFRAILDADWSSYFPGGSQERCFYVYIHFDPFEDAEVRLVHGACTITIRGLPFYVGKGTGDRAYDLKRNEGHGAVLRQVRARGAAAIDLVQIVADGLTEGEAFELEAKLIYFFGSRYDKGNRGPLVNLHTPAGPPIKPLLRKISPTLEQNVDAKTFCEVKS